MAVITPVLWTGKTNKRGEHPIYIRIEASDKRRYFSIKEYVKRRHWNASKCEVRRTHPLAEEINQLIQTQVVATRRAVLELEIAGKDITPGAIKSALAPSSASRLDFLAYGDEYAEMLRREGRIPTSKRYFSIMRKLRQFAGGPITFADVTQEFVRQYRTYMIESLKNSPSTVASNLRAIKSLINRAKDDELFPGDYNPFKGTTIKEPPGQKRKLTMLEIDALTRLDLAPQTAPWHVRNYFLFSLYTGGIRFRDVCSLQWGSVRDGRLHYKMSKTGRFKNMDLPPVAVRILDEYRDEKATDEDRVFPILKPYNLGTPELFNRAVSSQNARTNKVLKDLGELAEIGSDISFHMSRHSFASAAIEAGWDVRKVQRALGHGDLKTTANYLRELDSEFVGKEMEKLFGSS